MKMFTITSLVLLLFTCLLISCSVVRISDPQKQLVHPGVPSGTSGISYFWVVHVKKDIEIKSVFLQTTENTKIMLAFSLTELPSGKQLDAGALLPKGKYFMNAFLEKKNSEFFESEIVLLDYESEYQSKQIKIHPLKTKDLYMK